MDRDQVWQAIDAHRQGVADLLDQLSDEDWRLPSLCAGWTVRDVAAHLTLQQIGLGDVLRELPYVRPHGMNRLILDMAHRRAALPTAELVARIRATIGSRRHNLGVTPLETLIDILVHSQDIAVPVGRRLALDPAAAGTAATRVWALNWPFRARRRMAGFRLTATDTDWAMGEGAEVSAPIEAILLVLTGRLTALPDLSGAGSAALAARLSVAA
ncbi:maleylpyruvate isomerase family mycothiol-dependent enzyme [Catellatospora sichuanensis]|uniref:maleylpyruvate isomerase family mycothiol-dependent enzyme n=1 Tax=Catellatospora sichuanensis TaxID=1969805 RepID=UPI00118371CE|nr:maleylpyruvate isomerase family mycothiol-dependent enzyme [Catellatospora sichuanensis]